MHEESTVKSIPASKVVLAALMLAILVPSTQPVNGQGNGMGMGPNKRLVSGIEAEQRVKELTQEIRWNKDLNQALWEAKRDGKMVFWLHMLGDLSGAT